MLLLLKIVIELCNMKKIDKHFYHQKQQQLNRLLKLQRKNCIINIYHKKSSLLLQRNKIMKIHNAIIMKKLKIII